MLISQLLESEGPQLFRAIVTSVNMEPGTVITVPVRQDRKTRDSFAVFAMAFEYGIEKALGVKNIRRRALFAGAERDVTNGYGNVTLILDPPEQTPVIFNTGVRDSVDRTDPGEGIGNGEVQELHDFMAEMARKRSLYTGESYLVEFRKMMHRYSRPEWYLKEGDHLVKFEELMNEVLGWDFDEKQEMLNKGKAFFVEAAEWMASGYQKGVVHQLKPGNYEVMLYDITECVGTVVAK